MCCRHALTSHPLTRRAGALASAPLRAAAGALGTLWQHLVCRFSSTLFVLLLSSVHTHIAAVVCGHMLTNHVLWAGAVPGRRSGRGTEQRKAHLATDGTVVADGYRQ